MTAMGYLVGAGSMTLGVEQAGFKVQEVWETPGYGVNATSWDLNRPDLRHGVVGLDLRSEHFAKRQGLDLIYGNPPCGGVSSMDKSRGEDSSTNAEMRHWIRMVVKGRPRSIIMESGYQLDTPSFARLLKDLTNVLDDAGYWWWTWRAFSWQWGTPQLRRRMFLVASQDQPVRTDLLGVDDLPTDKAATPCGPYLADLAPVLPQPEPIKLPDGRVITDHWWLGAEGVQRLNDVIVHHRSRFEGGCVTPKQLEIYAALAEKDPRQQGPYEKAMAKLWADIPDFLNMKRFANFPVVLKPNLPARTMIGIHRFIHPFTDRILTVREMARLMGYPDTWRFHKCDPHYAIQGVPTWNANWVASRLREVVNYV